MTETQILSVVQRCLEVAGWLVIRTNAGRKGGVKLAPEGTSDLTCSTNTGRFVAIEVKRPGEKPRPAQKRYAEDVRRRNATYYVASSIEDVERIIRHQRRIET